MIKECGFCGKPFEVDEKNHDEVRRKYCSETCRCGARNKQNAERIKIGKKQYNVECEICGKVFMTNKSIKYTCSPECKQKRHNLMLRKNNQARREAIKNGTIPKPVRKKQKKVETLAEVQRKAREAGMSYGQYVQAEYIRRMQEGRMKDGGA